MKRRGSFSILRQVSAAIWRLLGGRRRSQVWRISHADRVLDRLAAIERPAARFAYLRKIDPFVFMKTNPMFENEE